MVFGSTYRIVYDSDTLRSDSIQRIFKAIYASLSTYTDSSTIMLINNSQTGGAVDFHLYEILRTSYRIWKETNGAFDLTVGPLVNAWGFGFSKKDSVNQQIIDSLLVGVGMDKIAFSKDSLTKQFGRTQLDVNAIAPGYCGDLISEMFNRNGIKNYLVDIGGEIRTNGVNPKHDKWRVGIDKPIEDPYATNRELQEVIDISGKSLATSGNYRKYYYKNGKKYSHTISPKTGYPIENGLLSVSVIASKTIDADAYATAFMVMGVDVAYEFVKSRKDLDAYFIYQNEKGELEVRMSSGFKDYISN